MKRQDNNICLANKTYIYFGINYLNVKIKDSNSILFKICIAVKTYFEIGAVPYYHRTVVFES